MCANEAECEADQVPVGLLWRGWPQADTDTAASETAERAGLDRQLRSVFTCHPFAATY
jgi:hypothetical protein